MAEVPAVAETPPIVQALGVDEASSVPTKTTTILSEDAVPIDTPVYVATKDAAATPAGFAVCVMATAIVFKNRHRKHDDGSFLDLIALIIPFSSLSP